MIRCLLAPDKALMTDQGTDCTGSWSLTCLTNEFIGAIYRRGGVSGAVVSPQHGGQFVKPHPCSSLHNSQAAWGHWVSTRAFSCCVYNLGEHPCDSCKSWEPPGPCKVSFLSLVSPPPSRKGNFNSKDKAIQHTHTCFCLNGINLTKLGRGCVAWMLCIMKWLSWSGQLAHSSPSLGTMCDENI